MKSTKYLSVRTTAREADERAKWDEIGTPVDKTADISR